MALIRHIERHDLSTPKVHGEAACTFTSFHSDDGEIYFQIDTYGSAVRQMKGKKSQTIQFDKTTAENLIEIIRGEMGLKAS